MRWRAFPRRVRGGAGDRGGPALSSRAGGGTVEVEVSCGCGSGLGKPSSGTEAGERAGSDGGWSEGRVGEGAAGARTAWEGPPGPVCGRPTKARLERFR
jgi:hypothetical protein